MHKIIKNAHMKYLEYRLNNDKTITQEKYKHLKKLIQQYKE